ncbi:DEAD/DEAH box helicase [Halosimplex amylolyticum]|uniref:DEAD/DEAH box helicase n=1 Tax=Halosimplex amylolyticum TaxID=3396616 RepID=UPI003F54964F
MRVGELGKLAIGNETPGEKFAANWLADLPEPQWPAYIDDSARLVLSGIGIGETDLTKGDFGFETGRFYREGLYRTAGIESRDTSLPIGNEKANTIGELAFEFARLAEELSQSSHVQYADFGQAVQAAVNKALVERIETGEIDHETVETLDIGHDATTVDFMLELFCRPQDEAYLEALIDTVSDLTKEGTSLLSILESPRMTTPLWEHQRAAVDAWLDNDCRGVLNMATATGKTVCGIAAIAHHFGELHPTDRDLAQSRDEEQGRATVVVVAHRKLILEQWQREFDKHLNIPEERDVTAERTASFHWGDVEFVTASHLQQRGVPNADLVILDETHHYVGGSGFGQLLDDFDGDVLALSGSLTNTERRSLERRDIPEIFQFTLRDGQEAGIVPTCSWTVTYTPYEGQANLASVTRKCEEGFERFQDGRRLEEINQELDDPRDDTGFDTLSEARSLSQSTLGRRVKEQDDEFRVFSSAIKSRQMTRYNLSPDLETVARLVLDHVREKKCVVLLESLDEIESVRKMVSMKLDDEQEDLLLTVSSQQDDLLETVEEFDEEYDTGALIGSGKTLGEGIDIKTAEVAINRGRGRLSSSLIQRMGRVLRNPTGDKHAEFYHVVGVPTEDDARLAEKDGIELLETAAQMVEWGQSLRAPPSFDVDSDAGNVAAVVEELEQAGSTAIEARYPDHYDPPEDEATWERLQEFTTAVGSATDRSMLLSLEIDKPEPEVEPVVAFALDEPATQYEPYATTTVEVECWVGELLQAALADSSELLDKFANDALREASQRSGRWTVPVRAEKRVRLRLRANPALVRILESEATDESNSLVSDKTSEIVQSALLVKMGLRGKDGQAIADCVEEYFEAVTPREYESVGDVVNRAQSALGSEEILTADD